MKTPDCVNRFVADFKRKEFAAIKILYFLVFGSLFTLFPFLTIQARSLGIRERELGLISSLLPIMGVFAPAAAGGIADKIGNFKVFLSITMAISGLSALIYLVVPPARITHILPDLLPLGINCTSNGQNVEVMHPYTCNYNDVEELRINVTSCSYRCTADNDVQVSFGWEVEPNLCRITENCVTESAKNGTIHPVGSDGYVSENPAEAHQISFKEQLEFSLTVEKTNDSHKLKLNSDICPDQSLFKTLNRLYYKNSEPVEDQVQTVCWLHCKSTAIREEMCSNTQSVEELDVVLTMTLYVVTRIINSIALVCTLPLFEGATVAILKQHNGDFGLQKLYSNIGQMFWTPISGALMDAFSDGKNVNYAPAFYLYCALKFLCAFVILFIDLEFKKPAKRLVRDLKSIVGSLEVITFIIVGFIAGAAFGVIDTFLFWLLEDMGAPKSLMGATVTVGAAFGIPMLVFSTPIIQKLGHVNTLILGFGFLVIRLLGYSFITAPWMAMPFEALECFTTSLFGVAATSYTSQLSTPGTVASLQGLFAGVMYGVGRGAGSMISGFLISSIGLRRSFQLAAVVCAVVTIVYFILNFVFFHKLELERREKHLKEKSNNEETIPKCNLEKGEQEENHAMENVLSNGTKSNNIKLEMRNNQTNSDL